MQQTFYPNEEIATITFRLNSKEKRKFDYYSKRYGGMTPTLLRFIADFVDEQTVRQGEMTDEENNELTMQP